MLIHRYQKEYLSPKTNSSSIVVEHCLFSKIKMTKNVDPDKYKYQDHRIGFDSTGTLHIQIEGQVKMLLLWGLIIQKIDDTTI